MDARLGSGSAAGLARGVNASGAASEGERRRRGGTDSEPCAPASEPWPSEMLGSSERRPRPAQTDQLPQVSWRALSAGLRALALGDAGQQRALAKACVRQAQQPADSLGHHINKIRHSAAAAPRPTEHTVPTLLVPAESQRQTAWTAKHQLH